jgi:putative DNA primase/helicase
MRFVDALRLAGLVPPDVVYPDGKIHRCNTESKPGRRNGWYVLHPDGHGVYGDWGQGGGEKLGDWRDDSLERKPVPKHIIDKMRRQREEERLARLRAIDGVRRRWAAAESMAGIHPYLREKGLSRVGCKQLRESRGQLLVPLYGERGSLVNLQSIDADGKKLFVKNAPVLGASFTIDRDGAPLTVFAEGLATGLALFQTIRHCRVVVVFNAGNLVPAMQRLRPFGSVVVAADNDWETAARIGRNPGLVCAQAAAELFGCGIAAPTCEGSDWADALREWGDQAPGRISRLVTAEARLVRVSG